ncbi:ABC transporter [Pseudoscourfieldia marina]
MPVPVSVTHSRGSVSHASHAVAPVDSSSAGLFANLGSAAPPPPPSAVVAISSPETNTQQHVASAPAPMNEAGPLIKVTDLAYTYPDISGQPPPGAKPLIKGMNFELHAGERALLIGANGAGKTTLLKILGGKLMVPQHMVQVLGRPAFHDTGLTTSGLLNYVGGNWQREVAFAGFDCALGGDFPASRMIDNAARECADPSRKQRLMEALDVNPDWRMHQVSDGQRRRVQLVVGLLREFKVLLLDEITVDLDVLGRASLMRFLTEECRNRGACIIYATHIFDGLERWPSHIMYVARGELQSFNRLKDYPHLIDGSQTLVRMVDGWLRENRRIEREIKAKELKEAPKEGGKEEYYLRNNGWAGGRLAASIAGDKMDDKKLTLV